MGLTFPAILSCGAIGVFTTGAFSCGIGLTLPAILFCGIGGTLPIGALSCGLTKLEAVTEAVGSFFTFPAFKAASFSALSSFVST